MQVITVATMSSLPRARALAASVRRHQPDWPLKVMLIGREEAIAAAAQVEGSLQLLSVARELDVDVETLLARHGEEDLSVLLLGPLLLRHAERTSEPVVHLPGTAWLLGDLQPIDSMLRRRSVVLVPRVSVDVPDDGLEPSREQLHRAGRIDDTIVAVDGGAAARKFLAWWIAHVEQTLGSLDAFQVGARPEDRPWLARFLELAPARFSTGVLADAGCNVSLWNLHRHTLEASGEQVTLDDEAPLRFVNLPGFDPDRPYRLAANASRARVSRSPVLRRLCTEYAQELRAAGWRDVDHRQEVGRRLTDELVYDDSLRATYSRALALGEGFEDLFSDEGTGAFLAWLEGPAPRGAAHGINRYVFYRVSRERPDVLRSYPDLDGDGGPEYVAWCWAFGRHELSIPNRFMPPRPGRSEGLSPAPVASPPREPAPPSPTVAASPETGGEVEVAPAPPIPVEPLSAATGAAVASDAEGIAVRLTGYLGHTLGLGAAARGYVRALGSAGVPVSTVTVPLHHLALPVELAETYGRYGFEDLVQHGGHGFEIVAVNADELPSFVERLGEDYFEGPRIGIWGWETNSIPPRWQRAFALVQEVWVYSRFMAQNIGAVAPVPVVALPPPVQRPAEPVEPLRLGIPEGFLFLFVFDYLSTVQRKNPVGLIEAFRRAFAPGEGPRLLIKTINGPLRPLSEEEVLWAADGREDIHVVDRSLTGEELDGLMAACDCYVSLHRAEGFGLTLAEAMAIGKPAIATGYSGNVDFMNKENSYLCDYTIGRVGPECEIYPPEGEWADPSVEHAAQLMREVHSDRAEAARRGERAAQDVARMLSPEATGSAMLARLQQLAKGTTSGRSSLLNGGLKGHRLAPSRPA
ncbi:MAG TPA: glycosyltransferase [Solirubrobacteraceae bacterium]|jgi:glycosyltransferase involved in cell wall biosynthesis|nr:glycosyltransferase [Solirubrobacteraceae bacterium]